MKMTLEKALLALKEKGGVVLIRLQSVWSSLWSRMKGTFPEGKISSIVRHRFALAILFLISLTIGYGAKIWASEMFTIGHEDYKLKPAEKLYSLNELRERALRRGASIPVGEREQYPAESTLIEE